MKKITLGIIIGILLATAIPAAAEEINKKVTATVRGDFSVEVDGESVALQNFPLAYNGNSYLPVRELATLLGKEVDFKDGVIKLDSPITSVEVEITSQSEFDAAIAKYEEEIIRSSKLLSGIISDIAGIKEQLADNPKTLNEALAVLNSKKAEYESIKAEAAQAIADLKAKYPEYA